MKLKISMRYYLNLFLLLILPLFGIAKNNVPIRPINSIRSVYWVSPDGNDSNPGTEEKPWLTPQKAATMAKAGDVVYFKPGIYHIDKAITIENSGTESAWITFSAAPGFLRKAIFSGNAGEGRKGAWFASGQSYIRLMGLTIQHIQSGAGIWIRGREKGPGKGSATGIQIIDCRIYNTSNMGIAVTGVPFPEDGTLGTPDYNITTDILIEGCDIEKTNEPNGGNECISIGEGVSNVVVRNNIVHNSDQYGIDFKEGVDGGKIYGNTIYGMEKHGIYIDAIGKWNKNIDVYNNKIFDVGGAGITLAREKNGATSTLQNIRVFNNIIYNTSKEGIQLYDHKFDKGGGVLENIHIMNNTIYNGLVRHGIRAIHSSISLSTVFIYNNIIYQTALQPLEVNKEVVTKNNLIGIDPMFVQVEAKNFHLKAGSPAIDKGVLLNAPAFDFDNAERPKGPGIDIGAYEQ